MQTNDPPDMTCLQSRNYLSCQRMFGSGVAVSPGGEQDTSSVPNQGDKAHLEISGGPSQTGRFAERRHMGSGIGHFHRAAIQTDEPPFPIACSLCPGCGERSDHVVMLLVTGSGALVSSSGPRYFLSLPSGRETIIPDFSPSRSEQEIHFPSSEHSGWFQS
jgi:hypothetical protein